MSEHPTTSREQHGAALYAEKVELALAYHRWIDAALNGQQSAKKKCKDAVARIAEIDAELWIIVQIVSGKCG